MGPSKRRANSSAMRSIELILICGFFMSVSLNAAVAASHSDLENLKFVAILHRHGDRAPLGTYANDPHKDYPWPGGWQALSPKGSLQMYNMGKNLRLRYKRLLPPDGFYTNENLRALSSSRLRCMASVGSLLAGLLPTNQTENLLAIPWQPVAVKPLPADIDYMLYQGKAPCPKYDRIYKKFLNDPDPQTEFYKYNQNLFHLYPYLSEHTGENITNIAQVSDLADTLWVQNDNGLELPAWAKPYFPDVLYGARARAYQLYTETPYMRRIRGGPILTDIFKQMQQKQNGKLSREIAVYSAHDTTLNFLMKALNVIDQTTILADYAASLALELHCKPEEECTVHMVHYWNSDCTTPKQLTVPQCPQPCTLSQFEDALRDNLIYDFAKECEF